MSAPLIAGNRDALAEALRSAGVEVGSVGGEAFRYVAASRLLSSGAVTTLPDALRELAEDDAAMSAVCGWISLQPLLRKDLHALASYLAAASP